MNCLTCDVELIDCHGHQLRCPSTCAILYKRERMRLYMSKRNLRKRQEKIDARTKADNELLGENYMIGLGTFILTKKIHTDIKKEYRDILRLKKLAGILN